MTTTRYGPRSVRNALSRLGDSMTSFDETAVSVPSTLIDLKSVYPLSRLRDLAQTTGSATVAQNEGRYEVSLGADGQASATLTSIERARYVAGYDGIPGMAVNLDRMPTGDQVVEWGNTDFVNGFVVGADANGMFTRLYSDGVAVATKRKEDWSQGRNLDVDPLNVHVYRMPYRWYASGPYRLMVDWVDEQGTPGVLPLDVFTSADKSQPITRDPNQPLNLRVQNNGTEAPITAYVMGRQYVVTGDYNPNRRIIGDFRAQQSVGNTFVPLIAFRQKTGVYTSVSTRLAGVGIISDRNLIWEARVLSTVTGGTWRAPRLTDSGVETAMEVNTSPTGFAEEGVQVWVGDPVAGGSGNTAGAGRADLPRLELPVGAQNEDIVLCARSVSDQTAIVTSVFRIREEW